MKNNSLSRNYSVLAVLVIGCAVAAYSFATPVLSQQAVGNQRNGSIAYAQLTIRGDDQVSWDPGGNDIPRVETLDVTYRRLGGTQRTTLVNLLNVVGRNGWELVEVTNNVWTFKR